MRKKDPKFCETDENLQMRPRDQTRRRFLGFFARAGLGATLAPGILWARMQDAGTRQVTLDMVTGALQLAGLDLSEAERAALVEGANRNLQDLRHIREISIPAEVPLPLYFSPVVPGMRIDRVQRPFRLSVLPALRRPANLEEAAFWPVRHLAELLRTRQVSSLELTEMYLARAHRYNGLLKNIVTFMDEDGLAAARHADAEIAKGRYRGALHGIPWGAKDIIAAKGHPTTWGSAQFRNQVFDDDASVVQLLRDAGAVLIAKVSTGELAGGDQWFGGQTKNPWNPTLGSDGSSAGSASATAAGCIAFGIGTETSGSILSPSARCGVTGLRPTFGRISRHGCMIVSWTLDRLGPICRYAEDTAIVMRTIAKPDGRDISVTDVPFAWDAQFDVRTLRVGVVQASFDAISDPSAKRNAHAAFDLLRSLGVTRFIPVAMPTLPSVLTGFPAIAAAVSVERTAFFDEHYRAGRMKDVHGGNFADGWLFSAPGYLQQQRGRMMMMEELAKATSGVDVYLMGSSNAGVVEQGTPAPETETQHAFAMANLAGYPAINLPNGFADDGSPTNMVIVGHPYREMEMIALARAYQDCAGFHQRTPQLDGRLQPPTENRDDTRGAFNNIAQAGGQ